MGRKIQRYDAEVVGGIHGVTCIFPTLRSVVDYEEKKKVPNQGYPRFVPHPFVVSVQDKHKERDLEVIAVQNKEAANFVRLNYFDDELRSCSRVESHNEENNNYGLIFVPKKYSRHARESITNTGIVLNSRKAGRIIGGTNAPKQTKTLSFTLSDLEKESVPELTFTYTSGMTAVFDALSSFWMKGTDAVVVGNTYVDTSRLFHNFPNRFSHNSATYFKVDDSISIPNSASLVFLEVPTNPLLQVANLESIVKKAHDRGAIVVVDSTIASPYHFSPFEFDADIVIHSTTKSLSGKNNHIGGVLFVNPRSYNLAKRLHHSIFALDEEEEIVLEENLRSFPDRIKRTAKNARVIADYLSDNKGIGKIYLPKGLKNGIGHIISFDLYKEGFEAAESFYDNCTLQIKGPSMGYERTMLMPYTLMTHFLDSDEDLARIGLKRYLIRLSVGVEDVDEIIAHLDNGIDTIK